ADESWVRPVKLVSEDNLLEAAFVRAAIRTEGSPAALAGMVQVQGIEETAPAAYLLSRILRPVVVAVTAFLPEAVGFTVRDGESPERHRLTVEQPDAFDPTFSRAGRVDDAELAALEVALRRTARALPLAYEASFPVGAHD